MGENKTLYKDFLLRVPIWGCVKLSADLKSLNHEADNYLDGLNQKSKRIDILTRHSRSRSDQDVVKTYNKNHKSLQALKIDNTPPVNAKGLDKLRDWSILKLESKIENEEEVFAMTKLGKPWVRCKVVYVFRRPIGQSSAGKPVITFRLRTLTKDNSHTIDVDKYSVARIQDHGTKLKPTKRVIAGLTETKMMPGIIGQSPDEENKSRYLVLMDDGSASYFHPNQVYPIIGQTDKPWQDARKLRNNDPNVAAHNRAFFGEYPYKVRMVVKVGDRVDILRDGSLVPAQVVSLDCDTLRVLYRDDTEESVLQGSPRLIKRSNYVSMQLKSLNNWHPDLAFMMQLYEEASRRALDEDVYKFIEDFHDKIILSRGRNTARKSTNRASPPRVRVKLDNEPVDDDHQSMAILDDESEKKHTCSLNCLDIPGVKTERSVVDIIDEFRNISDLKVPLLLGWKRKLSRVPLNTRSNKTKYVIIYESPCGRVFQQPYTLRRHLIKVGSILDIDYFSFDREIQLNRESGDLQAYYYLENIAVESKTGKPLENKNISVINLHNEERLPIDFEYRNETFPHPLLKEKGFSFDYLNNFKSSCDCEDDCFQRATCACHRLNEEFSGKNAFNRGTVEAKCQYNHKRLPCQVNTGIFECNSWCKCSSKCSNRVVQNGIRFRLQVRKTIGKGWGVCTLDDIPTGAFICTYSAELLDDADQYGDSDMYYADLDYITVNEGQKECYSDTEKSDEGIDSDDDSSSNKKLGKRKSRPPTSESDESEGGNEVRKAEASSRSSSEREDSYLPKQPTAADSEAASRYPRRKPQPSQNQSQAAPPPDSHNNNRRRNVQFRPIHEILESHDYTLDARMQGNVGRFFNHSCDPNASVQNVFIETHDLRFPVVAFFAHRTIRAMDEITWNYNYKMGCIEGREIKCRCGASNCRGRIL